MRNTALFALALIASAITVTPTVAQAFEPVTVTSIVRTADLDLSNDSGQRELDRRIVRAAREVCGEASNVDLEGGNAVRQCREDTIALATSQREQLLAAARTGSPIVVASAR
jgi:UrcA family protein